MTKKHPCHTPLNTPVSCNWSPLALLSLVIGWLHAHTQCGSPVQVSSIKMGFFRAIDVLDDLVRIPVRN